MRLVFGMLMLVTFSQSYCWPQTQIKSVNGISTSPSEYPEVCLVGNKDQSGYKWHCSGVLVARNLVLTAAHCGKSTRDSSSGRVDGNRVANVVALGVTMATRDLDSEIKRVSKIVEHVLTAPGSYDCSADGYTKHDIIGLVLDEDSSTSSRPSPVNNIESREPAAVGKICIVGFGSTSSPNSEFVQRKAEIKTNVQEDQRRYGFHKDFEFVAGGILENERTGRDACSGDSGGPAYAGGCDVRPKVVLGLISRTVKCGSCGDGTIYTELSKYTDFIGCATAIASGSGPSNSSCKILNISR